MRQKGALSLRSKINFRISGINISLVFSDSAENLLLNPIYQNLIRKFRRSDITHKKMSITRDRLKISTPRESSDFSSWVNYFSCFIGLLFLNQTLKK